MLNFSKNFCLYTPWQKHNVCAGITTRTYEGLNVRADISDVFKNLKISLPEQNIIYLKQIHSAIIQTVNTSYKTILEGDGLITTQQNVCIVIKTADCVPVFIFHPKTKTACLLHVGWRSAYARIIPEALNLLNLQANELEVFIGPCLRQECFTVQEDFLENIIFRPFIFKQDNTLKFNIIKFIFQELISKKIPLSNIYDSGICSSCSNDKFFSHRKETGSKLRTLSFIYLK